MCACVTGDIALSVDRTIFCVLDALNPRQCPPFVSRGNKYSDSASSTRKYRTAEVDSAEKHSHDDLGQCHPADRLVCVSSIIKAYHKAMKTDWCIETHHFITGQAYRMLIALIVSVVATQLLYVRDPAHLQKSSNRPAIKLFDQVTSTPPDAGVSKRPELKWRRSFCRVSPAAATGQVMGHRVFKQSLRPPKRTSRGRRLHLFDRGFVFTTQHI
jgi:hypothetical protein